MKNLEKMCITDNSRYEAGKCNTGGAYSFSTIYRRNDDGTYNAIYSTSADFPYCPMCGSFYTGGDDCPYCDGQPDVLAADEVLSAVLQAAEDPDFEISWSWEEAEQPVSVWDEEDEYPTDGVRQETVKS